MAKKSLCFLYFLVACFCFCVESYDGSERDATGCPKVFQGRCHCGLADYKSWDPDRKVFLTNCTNSGFKNTTMLEYLPEETQVLVFTGNHLDTLPWNLFGIFDEKVNLEVLDLTNNRIKEIQGKSFHKVTTVKRLILDHNDLYIVSALHHQRIFSNFENIEELHLTNAFTEQIDSKWYLKDLKEIFGASQLLKLKKLHLEQNEIWEIKDSDMFCDLPELRELHLGDNQLTDINFSLDCLRQLRYLDLEFNKITNLRKSTLAKLDQAFAGKTKNRRIDLHGNPYNCDCHFMPFLDWLKQTKVNLDHKEDMRCYSGKPDYNAGKRIENIDKLTCLNSTNTTDVQKKEEENVSLSSSHANTTLLIILIVLVSVFLAVLLYVNRDSLRKITRKGGVGSVGRDTRNKYSSIEESTRYSTIYKKEEDASQVNVWSNPFNEETESDLLENWEEDFPITNCNQPTVL